MTISPKRLAEIEAIPDDQIDYSDLPEIDDAFFKTARLVLPDAGHKQGKPIRDAE